MSSPEQPKDSRKSSPKEKVKEINGQKKNNLSTKLLNTKNIFSPNTPNEKPNQIPFIPERDLQVDFSLSFKEIYNIHITEIELKTNLKRKYIYYFLLISLFFFLIGHFELFFSYIITGYFPIKWTYQDFKTKKENSGKKWGTYWAIFLIFIFFDIHKKEVLKIIPLYFIVKTIFLMILYLPGFTAAVNLYDGFFKDIIQKFSVYIQNKNDNETMANDLKKLVKLKTE